jgi:hypothetical protein
MRADEEAERGQAAEAAAAAAAAAAPKPVLPAEKMLSKKVGCMLIVAPKRCHADGALRCPRVQE